MVGTDIQLKNLNLQPIQDREVGTDWYKYRGVDTDNMWFEQVPYVWNRYISKFVYIQVRLVKADLYIA